MTCEQSKNLTWGFYGTTLSNYPKSQTETRWEEALTIIQELSGESPEVVRRYLDSRAGRHLADRCYNEDVKTTIEQVFETWIKREIKHPEYDKADKDFYN